MIDQNQNQNKNDEKTVDVEKLADLAVKNVKRQSYHILLTIDQNNLRFCLKQSFIMLCELRTNQLNPKYYFQLYNQVVLELKNVEKFMQEDINRGRLPEDIYDSVLQCRFVIPRLYLAILSGSLYIKNNPKKCKELLNDLSEMVMESQNPLRGIFTRYYLLQMVKDKLPDKENNYVKEEGGTFEDTLSFLIKNMEEMNRLWIRISYHAPVDQKETKLKEREDLKPLIQESITVLNSLQDLTIEIYEHKVLPKLIDIIFMYTDALSQEFVIESIIKTFPVVYNIKCMEFILLTISKLTEGVNVKLLFIIILETLTKYTDDILQVENEEERNKLSLDLINVYPVLMRNFDIIMNNEIRSGIKNIIDVLDLNMAFLKYTNKCAPENEQLNSINHILNLTMNIFSVFGYHQLLKTEIDKICELLSIPLESVYSLFDMPDFPKLLSCLDYNNMKILALNIINNLINPNSKEKIDSLEKINKLFTFITPLLQNVANVEEEQCENFDVEQNSVAKLIFAIKPENIDIFYSIYVELKNVLYKGGKKRRIITFPALVNSLILFTQKITTQYENKNEENENENEINIHPSYDISRLDNDDKFYEYLSKLYDLLNDVIKVIQEDFPMKSVKYYLLAASQVDNVNKLREKFLEKCLLFLSNAISVYKTFDNEKKFDYFTDICQKLLKITIVDKENLEKIINDLSTEAKNMPKRIDQCNGYLMLSQLYFLHFKDGKKVLDYLNKAKKVADFSLTNPHNLILYVLLLNKYIYYIDVDHENVVEINGEQIEDLIEAIKNHMDTIKTDKNIDASFLPAIENYFRNTVKVIELRKNEKEHKSIYDSINITSN